MRIEGDATLPVPDVRGAVSEERVKAVRRMLEARDKAIRMARHDPLNYGYEPDVWLVARAMLGRASIPKVRRILLAERTGWDEATCWERWSEELCVRLGLKHRLSEVLIPGANRCAKTEFGAKLCHEVGLEGGRKIVIGSQKQEKSVEVQQARLWRYMPPAWRQNLLGVNAREEYIKFSDKNGFTGNGFITANRSRFGFVFYTQRLQDVFEGEEGNLYWMDEEVDQSWLATMRYRVASVRGQIVVTFTPVSGYTPAVGEYQDGMRVVRWCHGYMLPRDGGESAPWAAAGLTRGEMETLERDTAAKLPPTVPYARSEDCVGWVTGEWGEIGENAEPGRVWERVPRVALCRDDERGIVWFHGCDNPYGNPLEVIKKAMLSRRARDEIRTRVYGMALRQAGKRFAAFDRRVHVVDGGDHTNGSEAR